MFYHVCTRYIRYLAIVAVPVIIAHVEKWRVALAFAVCQLIALLLAGLAATRARVIWA
ncbi:hypothetical protein DPMN_016871 [Dreissena polymorpha]|uniref:Uncharacterized protein n=1 Tax=Dreissena polymorpha TaxID=45954 RepID=A0A9D4NAF7_DREPO|nr:hypothetical protein DPMN_016871 [Dreissena polymorpha]